MYNIFLHDKSQVIITFKIVEMMKKEQKIKAPQKQALNIPVSGSKEYSNIPPKDIMNAIWGACFDYKDFNDKILNETIRDRIYDSWQRIHQCINGWIIADEKNFLDYIKQNKPDLEQ